MTIISTLDDVIDLYAARGDRHYGEGVTQREHAVQCAMLAEADGGSPDLVVASLLHDIGHLLVDPDDLAVDDRHEHAGAVALAALFGPSVTGTIALHVAAKRYLCSIEPAYPLALSGASQRSLVLQGGAFDRAQADAFERLPHWREAVALRRLDDMGKRDEAADRRFDEYIPAMRSLLTTARSA